MRTAGAHDNVCATLADLLQDYLRLHFDLPPGEISQSVLTDAFNARSLPDDLCRDAQDLLNQCDAGRFTTDTIDAGEKQRLIERSCALCDRLERGPS